jgi:hypothetical protein
MAEYRLYSLGRDGHINQGSDIAAEDDEEAIALARLGLERADVEIWRGTRKVALIPQGMPPVLLGRSKRDA